MSAREVRLIYLPTYLKVSKVSKGSKVSKYDLNLILPDVSI